MTRIYIGMVLMASLLAPTAALAVEPAPRSAGTLRASPSPPLSVSCAKPPKVAHPSPARSRTPRSCSPRLLALTLRKQSPSQQQRGERILFQKIFPLKRARIQLVSATPYGSKTIGFSASTTSRPSISRKLSGATVRVFEARWRSSLRLGRGPSSVPKKMTLPYLGWVLTCMA